MKFKALKLIIAMVALLLPLNAHAEKMGIADPARDKYYSALEGKKVAFVPLAMGFDLTLPIAETCAFTLMPNLAIIGEIIAAAATIGAVNRALDVPPPRKSAFPSVFFIMTMS